MARVPLSPLTRAFAWIGTTSIGGGRATYFYETFVVRRRWVTSEEFVRDFTLSQLLPGPTVSNLAVTLGRRLRGVPGAACGVLAVLVPGALALLLLSALYFGRGASPGVETALRGMGAAVVGMLFVTTARLSRGALKQRGGLPIAVLVFLGAGPFRLNALLVALGAGALGLWIHRPRHSPEGADAPAASPEAPQDHDRPAGPDGGVPPSPPGAS